MRPALVCTLVFALAGVTAGCAGSDDGDQAEEPPCRGLPKLEPSDPRPGMPKPVSLEGVVSDYEAEYWTPGETDTRGGLCVVSKTAKGTFALTGIVQAQPAKPIQQARVTLESIAPGQPPARAEAVTDIDGAFAFVDMPARPKRSCYRTSIVAKGYGRYVLVSDDVGPGQQYQQTIELTRAVQRYTDARNPRNCRINAT